MPTTALAITAETIAAIDPTRRGDQRHISDVYTLTEAVWQDCRTEPDAARLALAYLILNRTADSRWPPTIQRVVYGGDYFAWAPDRRHRAILLRTPDEVRDWRACCAAAADSYYGRRRDPAGASHHADAQVWRPLWFIRLVRQITLGRWTFGWLPPG